MPEIEKVISEFLKHDPNYTYDDDDSEVEEGANMDTDGTIYLLFRRCFWLISLVVGLIDALIREW